MSAVRASRASATTEMARSFAGVERVDVDADDRHVRVLEDGPRRRHEIAQSRADGDHQVGIARQPIRGEAARRADRPDVHGVVPGKDALAGL